MNTDSTILIAVDGEAGAERTVAAATSLFGIDTTYRFVHVAQPVPMTPPLAAGPGGVAPVGVSRIDANRLVDDAIVHSAREVARRAALDAGMAEATAVGLDGDPAEALIEEAISSGSAAIVVGAHDRSWPDQLLTRSVTDELRRESPVPIVVVPAPG